MLAQFKLVATLLLLSPAATLESCAILTFSNFTQLFEETYSKLSIPLKSRFIADFQYVNWNLLEYNGSYYLPFAKSCRNPLIPRPEDQPPLGVLYIESPEFGNMMREYGCSERGQNMNEQLDYNPGVNFYKDESGTYISVVTSGDIDSLVRHKYNGVKLGNLHSAFSDLYFCFGVAQRQVRKKTHTKAIVDYSLVNYFEFRGKYLVGIQDKAMAITKEGNQGKVWKLLNSTFRYWLELTKRDLEFYSRPSTVFVNDQSLVVYTTILNRLESLDTGKFVIVLTHYFGVLDMDSSDEKERRQAQEVSKLFNGFIGCFYFMNRYSARSFQNAMTDSPEWKQFIAATVEFIIEQEPGAIDVVSNFLNNLSQLSEYVSNCQTKKLLQNTGKAVIPVPKPLIFTKNFELIGNYLFRKTPDSIAALNSLPLLPLALALTALACLLTH